MKKISLLKYGFERSKEDDFSDDGNYFTCYRHPEAPNIRVSKLVADGEAYLSANVNDLDIDYEEYKNCPHYEAANWKYNPISVDSITDDDLKDFTNAIIEYQKECEEALKNAYTPTREELEAKYDEEYSQAIKDKTKLNELFETKIRKILLDPKITTKEYGFSNAITYFKEAVINVENILKRPKKEYIDELMTQSRISKKYHIKREIKSDWHIKYAEEYIDEILKK